MALHESALGLTPDRAHDMALKEEEVRAKKPSAVGFLQSNHQYAEVYHRVVVRESRGEAGTLFSYYRAALCGAKLAGAWGSTYSEGWDPRLGRLCPKCEVKASGHSKRCLDAYALTKNLVEDEYNCELFSDAAEARKTCPACKPKK